ncbi:MAG: SRPBCC family protein [Actinomycetota bacterium]|jgi:ribosome-associated toxin RatA of RatAB toxin-antitoxin module|nr:SRPBCC family protein [Actinomycetota bacterium]
MSDEGEHVAEQATERVVVGAPPLACFEVVGDVERYPSWAADVKAVHVDERDGEGRPSLVTFRAAAFGRSTSYTLEYDYAGAPSRLAWRQVAGDLTSKLDGSYSFAPAGDIGTEVAYTLEVELRVPLPGFIKRRAQTRIMHIALSSLKNRVESPITT